MFLTEADANTIDALVARVESRTGVQIVTAVVGKSDSYVELPWKAFALGASLAACGVVMADAVYPEWMTARRSGDSSCARRGATSRCASMRSRCF